jgi:hypothetical protein
MKLPGKLTYVYRKRKVVPKFIFTHAVQNLAILIAADALNTEADVTLSFV